MGGKEKVRADLHDNSTPTTWCVPDPIGDVVDVRHRSRHHHESDGRPAGFHTRDDDFECATAGFVQDVDLHIIRVNVSI